jgi:hypothetical protein
METWVLSVDASLRARLEADGLVVLPFTIPPEYAGWPSDRQQAMSLVAKGCMLESGSAFSPVERWNATFDGADLFGPYYGSYYLPYDETTDDTQIPSFPERVRMWKEFAVQTGYGPAGKRVTVSDRMIRGWPAHDNAKRFDDHGLKDGIQRPIPYIDIGWPMSGRWGQGVHHRQHRGPNAVVLMIANQHPRELVTYEAAWRLAQRIVAYYALADVDDPSVPQTEGGRPRGFWRDLIDAGLHVVIVPTVNPSTYNDVVVHQWPAAPIDGGKWWRTNGNFVDINRNFPAHWLQGGWDSEETWGRGQLPTDSKYAGTAPASEPETHAVLEITKYSVRELLYGDMDLSSFVRRLPVVAVDLHSAYGMVTSFTHYSNTVETGTGPTEEAWLCGAVSDCLHADTPGMLAMFGNNERPSVVGTSGLARSLYGPTVDDPATPYMHGSATYNFYATSGDVVATWSDARWAVDEILAPRPIMSGTVEATAYGKNPFGFGTCAPPDTASKAIDAVVEDLLPLLSRLGEGAFDPADVPRGATPLRGDVVVPFPETAGVVNMGIRAEAVAQAKSWRTADGVCTPPSDDNEYCFRESPCDPSSHTCTGPWWSSYWPFVPGQPQLREPLARYWGFAVRHPDPLSFFTQERRAIRARLRLLDCAPADACADLPFVLIRRGGHFDLYGLLLPATAPTPGRVRIVRQLQDASSGDWADDLTYEFVAREIPGSASWEASSCASSVPGAIEVRSLLEPGERVKNLKATVPLLNGMRNELQVGFEWIGPGDHRVCEVLELRGAADWDFSWPRYDFSAERPYVWHTHDFDLWRAAAGVDPSTAWTDGAGIWLVHDRVDHDDSFMLPPTVTADLSGNGQYGDCLLTQLRMDARSLERARAVRESMLQQGPWGRRYVAAYGRFSSELATLAGKHPVLRQSLNATLREAMRLQDGGKGLLDHAALVRAALPAIAIVRRHGSADLRKATELALAHLPDLRAERARYAPSTSIRTGLAHGGSHGRH